MKAQLPQARLRQRGYALIMVMVFAGIGILALAGALNWVTSSGMQIARSNQHYKTVAAAEAATEKVLTRISQDYKNNSEASVYSSLSTYAALVPTSTENPVWANYIFNDAQGNSGKTYIQRTATQSYVPLESKYSGLQGFAANYRVISNARETTASSRFNITSAVQQDVQLASIPIFQFAIFYSGDLEFTRAATLSVRGRVHANGTIYTGSSADLSFYEDVTASSVILHGELMYGGGTNGAVNYYDTKTTNVNVLELPIGTNNTPAAVREVLQPPPSSELVTSAMGKERFYNKAELVILVSNSTVTVGTKVPFATSLTSIPWQQITNFVSTNKTFTDQRENDKVISTTEIDVGKYITWAGTNGTVIATLGAGKPPNLIYVADRRTESSTKLSGVRLVNAQTLPSRGLTVATPNPLYTKGHFNAPAANLGTTNTANTKPASLIADAYTMLSGAFVDADSDNDYTDRKATDTTVNAAVVAGNVPVVGETSGGVHNLTRLLESWSGRSYYLNGSLVRLFDSAKANQPYQSPGNYYSAPTRNINFDTNFKDSTKLPPGTPELRALVRARWATPPASTITYAGP